MSAIADENSRFTLDGDGAKETYKIFLHVKTAHINYDYILNAYVDYDKGAPRYRISQGQQQEVYTAISHFTPYVNRLKDYKEMPKSGYAYVCDGTSHQSIKVSRELYVYWEGRTPICVGIVTGFQIVTSTSLPAEPLLLFSFAS
ncbi:MAG: hypothetical protein EOO17_01485 [Chloroflexi bacterium]|nr:MAG: hypothetical protein EOO17_01485 [Chloroflexota bacterium]